MVAQYLGKRRFDFRSVRAYLKPCLCGNTKINVNNNKGWSDKSLYCPNCGRYIEAKTVEETIAIWNKEYNEKFPEIIDD